MLIFFFLERIFKQETFDFRLLLCLWILVKLLEALSVCPNVITTNKSCFD